MRALSILFAAGCAAVFCSPAQSAVSVIGSGPAEICYQGADSHGSPLDFLQYCDQALAGALTPSHPGATFVHPGGVGLAMNSIEAAAADFNAGLAINANLGEAYVDRGATLIAKRHYAEAIADITKGLGLGTKEAQNAYYDRGVANEA